MKKKKLKKKIKELEDQLVGMYNAHDKILRTLRDRISALDDVITNNHNSHKAEFGTLKANKRATENEICSLKKQVDILRQRTETDYTQFKPFVDTSKGPDTEEPNEQRN